MNPIRIQLDIHILKKDKIFAVLKSHQLMANVLILFQNVTLRMSVHW